MRGIDWTLMVVFMGMVLAFAIYSRRYVRSVAGFMSAGRIAGRYVLAVSRGEVATGTVVFVTLFEIVSKGGFTWMWWNWLTFPVVLLISVTGFVAYRYRETRAMTLAQLFELRYSKSFRVFTGLLGFSAGILNFGIIPVIEARFITNFLGLPPVVHLGNLSIETHLPMMALLLGVTLFITLGGGLITVMLTDCLQGIFSQLLFVVIIIYLVSAFNWHDISNVLGNRPPGQSLLDPFNSLSIKDFNLWYILMAAAVNIYGTMAWQNQSAYNSAGRTPHENRMGNVLGLWRTMGNSALIYLLTVCALTFLTIPHFASGAAAVGGQLSRIADPQAREQMRIPVALSYLLPEGIRGAFCAILVMGVFSGESTHLHSWGGLFVQDVLVPLRKRPFGPRNHITALRLSITGVALFAFCFGALFQQNQYIVMWFVETAAVYVGGAGAVIIGGLYWKKGTTPGAWAALLTGSSLSLGGIVTKQMLGSSFPLNGMEVSFGSCLVASAVYMTVSLLTCREDYNMDRLLHRGIYAEVKRELGEATMEPGIRRKLKWGKIIGFDQNFTRGDKWIAGGAFGWGLAWFLVSALGSLWNLFFPWPEAVWSTFWHVAGVGVPAVMAVVTGCWFAWGGVRDMYRLFVGLRVENANDLDDGTVVGHVNMDEKVVVQDIAVQPGARVAKTGIPDGRLV